MVERKNWKLTRDFWAWVESIETIEKANYLKTVGHALEQAMSLGLLQASKISLFVVLTTLNEKFGNGPVLSCSPQKVAVDWLETHPESKAALAIVAKGESALFGTHIRFIIEMYAKEEAGKV